MQRKFKVIKSFGVRWIFMLACQCFCHVCLGRAKQNRAQRHCMPFHIDNFVYHRLPCRCFGSKKNNNSQIKLVTIAYLWKVLICCWHFAFKMDTKQTPTFVKFHTISSVCGCSFLHSCSSFLGFCHIFVHPVSMLQWNWPTHFRSSYIYVSVSIETVHLFGSVHFEKAKFLPSASNSIKNKNSWLIKFESFVQKLIAHSTKNLHCIFGLVIDTNTVRRQRENARFLFSTSKFI